LFLCFPHTTVLFWRGPLLFLFFAGGSPPHKPPKKFLSHPPRTFGGVGDCIAVVFIFPHPHNKPPPPPGPPPVTNVRGLGCSPKVCFFVPTKKTHPDAPIGCFVCGFFLWGYCVFIVSVSRLVGGGVECFVLFCFCFAVFARDVIIQNPPKPTPPPPSTTPHTPFFFFSFFFFFF